MAEKILVTGASGFIAANCIIDLLEHGYQVRGTVRALSRVPMLLEMFALHTDKADQIEFVEAELLSYDGWPDAVKGCSGVFHVASPVPIVQPKDPMEVIAPAKTGALNALKAAHKEGIKRFVLTSSVAAIAYGDQGKKEHFTEQDWTNLNSRNVSPYFQSKTLAEKAAWEYAQDKDIELVTVNPGVVFGPALEADYGSSLQIIIEFYTGKFPVMPRIGFEAVDVRDVASLHRIAFEHPEAKGQRLPAVNGFIWFKEMTDVIKQNFPENKCPSIIIPNFLFNLVENFIPETGMFRGETGKLKTIDPRAPKALGWEPRSVEEAVIAGTQSLIDHGVLKG